MLYLKFCKECRKWSTILPYEFYLLRECDCGLFFVTYEYFWRSTEFMVIDEESWNKFTSSNPDIGFSEEKIPIQYPDGEVLEIGFNARYFIDVLNCLESEEIILEFSDESSPAIIKTQDDPSFLALVMPMRI